MPRNPKPIPRIYQLKLTLRGSRPPIFRRILVPASETLEYLHHVIQIVMPWQNSHLHQFCDKRNVCWTDPDFGLDHVQGDETVTRIEDVLKSPKDQVIYQYD